MASLLGVFAASHGPIIARDWEKLPDGQRKRLAAGFDEIGRQLRACRPDLLVVVSPDHWVNFFISNLPAVCIGIGQEHDGPPEPFMKKVFPHERLKGHAGFGRHLLEKSRCRAFGAVWPGVGCSGGRSRAILTPCGLRCSAPAG
jgi:hypothetical protein